MKAVLEYISLFKTGLGKYYRIGFSGYGRLFYETINNKKSRADVALLFLNDSLADQALFFLLIPISPARPETSSSADAGAGTGVA